jgi:peptidoglycan/xylan/chitin deacetylase (PgdA/CDA1 family)
MRLPRLRRRGRRRPVILMYHRVATPRHDPWGLAVDPVLFDEQMCFLSRERMPLSMDAFVAEMRRGTLAPDHVAITFDDGYLDNLTNALPAVSRHGVPATLFVLTGAIRSGSDFWWDEMTDLVLAQRLEKETSVVVSGRRFEFDWVGSEPRPGWRATERPRNSRERTYLLLYPLLQTCGEAEREAVFDRLRQDGRNGRTPDRRSMTLEESRRLVSDGLMTLGGHSVTHPRLDCLADQQLPAEIDECWSDFQGLFGPARPGFAYPYGKSDRRVRRRVAETGFAWACSTRLAPVETNDDPFDLPRIAVGNWSAKELERVITF